MVWLRRLGRVAGLVMLVALFSAPGGLVQAALVWQTETVDETNVGSSSSLALDGAGHPHISYYDQGNAALKYAVFDGTTWHTETIDEVGEVGSFNSLAVDAAGRPHISYLDASNGDLKYATFDGSDWQIETVDEEGNTGYANSIVLDSAGLPHISYQDNGNFNLKYAVFDGTDWTTETVEAAGNVGLHTSLALDSQGDPRISFIGRDASDLKYAIFDGTAWQVETIDEEGAVGHYNSLALDGADQPHISYYDLDNRDLKYATFDGTSWTIEIVDAGERVGQDTSLALDSTGQPRISYYDSANGDLKYAAFDGTDWNIETADAAGTVGPHTSLALDSSDMPHISYFNIDDFDLKYAHLTLNEPPSVDAGGPYSGEEGSPIAIQATVSDPESDELTTTWSYTIDDADPGTTCAFGDASQLETAFTCTDDGSFTVTLTANDGVNPPVSDSAAISIANVAPEFTSVAATAGANQATITVVATDPGQNDVLSYAFDCNNDGTYEIDAGATPSTTCPLNAQQEGTFTFGAQVSDDDGAMETDTVTVTIATHLCANNHTGVLRYTNTCQNHETSITLPDDDPVTVCANTSTRLLRAPSNGKCAGHETRYVLPEDGPLTVCVNRHTQVVRVVDNLGQCVSHEFGRVLAATEVGFTAPRSS